MQYPSEQELTLRDLSRTLRRSFPLIALTTAAGVLLGLLACLVVPRQYQATGTIRVQSSEPPNFDLNILRGDANAAPASSDSLSADIELQTEVGVLSSNALALRVIRELNLANTPDFEHKKSKLPWHRRSASGNVSATANQQRLLAIFHKNLSIKPIGGTSLVEISYLSSNPAAAATVVNGVIQALGEETFESQDSSAKAASQALNRQLADLRVRSESLQTQVARMQQDSGLYSMGTTDTQGHAQAYSAVLDQFQRAATNLSNADENRILKEGIAQAAQSGDAELLSSLAGNGAASSGVASSFTTLQNLRTQQASMQGQLDQLKVKFGSGYPLVGETEANLNALNTAIQQETHRIAERAQTDYEVAQSTWKDAKQDYDEQKSKADALNNKSIQYGITRQDADETRALYEDLLRRLKEAGILQSMRFSSFEVTDPPLTPSIPAKPNTKLFLAAGFGGGLFLGAAAALLLSLLSDRLREPKDVELLGLPIMGLLPARAGRSKGYELAYDNAVRSLRSRLVRTTGQAHPAVILVVQAAPEPGRWLFPLDLASSFAWQGKRSLMVDADVDLESDSPVRGQLPEAPQKLLIGSTPIEEIATMSSPEPNLSVLPLRPQRGEISDLLDSERMRNLLAQWRERFDVIVIQAAPVIPFPDAIALSEVADVTILCGHLGSTSKTSLKRAYDQLRQGAKGEVLVLLDGEKDARAYDDFYGYSSRQVRFQ